MTKKRQFCPRGHDTFQVGRDASKRCLQCKAEDGAFKAALAGQALAEQHVAFERRQAEASRRREAEYQWAIKAGGMVATEARWHRAYTRALDETSSRYGLCQWAQKNDRPGGCFRRTADVYCAKHNQELEREVAREKRQKAAEQATDPPSEPKAPRTRSRPPGRHAEPPSRWHEYKRDHPERQQLYRSGAWAMARDRQLREHPFCVVCGAKASVADHVLNRARGGADLDPRNLQSMCKRCHHAKTVEESHRGMKRAAERRRRGLP